MKAFLHRLAHPAAILVAAGTLFTIYNASLGIACTGMGCIDWGIGWAWISVGGWPWSFAVHLLPDALVPYARADLSMDDPTLQLRLWPTYLIRYLALMINCLILGWLLYRLSRFVGSRRRGASRS